MTACCGPSRPNAARPCRRPGHPPAAIGSWPTVPAGRRSHGHATTRPATPPTGRAGPRRWSSRRSSIGRATRSPTTSSRRSSRRRATARARRSSGASFVFGGTPSRRLPADPGRGGDARGGARSRGPTGATRRAAQPPSPTAATIRSCTSAGSTRSRSARWSGHPAAHGSRVGARRRGGLERLALPVGGRARAGRRAPDERVPGRVPRREHRRRRVARHLPGRGLPAQRVRAPQDDRATCGSGARTGSTPDYYRRRPGGRPTGPSSAPPGDARRLVPLPRVATAGATGSTPRSANTPDSSTGNLGFRVVR